MRVSVYDVYEIYKEVKADYNDKGYRMPKDWNDFLKYKISKKDREILELITGYFNTKWRNISIYEYMRIGSELYKSFNIKHFLNRKIFMKYIERDKNKKRELINSNAYQGIRISLDRLDQKNLTIEEYCNLRNNDNRRLIIDDYLKNRISPFFVVWMVKSNKISLKKIDKNSFNDEEMLIMSYIFDGSNWKKLSWEINRLKNLLDEMEEIHDTKQSEKSYEHETN